MDLAPVVAFERNRYRLPGTPGKQQQQKTGM